MKLDGIVATIYSSGIQCSGLVDVGQKELEGDYSPGQGLGTPERRHPCRQKEAFPWLHYRTDKFRTNAAESLLDIIRVFQDMQNIS
jgi:hypothetical protein